MSDSTTLISSAIAPAASLVTLLAGSTARFIRSRPSLRRRVVLTGVSWPPRPGEKVFTVAQRVSQIRGVMTGFALLSLAYTAFELSRPAADAAAITLKWVAVVIGLWGIVAMSLVAVNVDVRQTRNQALSNAHRVVELTLTGDGVDGSLAEFAALPSPSAMGHSLPRFRRGVRPPRVQLRARVARSPPRAAVSGVRRSRNLVVTGSHRPG